MSKYVIASAISGHSLDNGLIRLNARNDYYYNLATEEEKKSFIKDFAENLSNCSDEYDNEYLDNSSIDSIFKYLELSDVDSSTRYYALQNLINN